MIGTDNTWSRNPKTISRGDMLMGCNSTVWGATTEYMPQGSSERWHVTTTVCGTTASLDSNSGNIASYNSKRVTTTTVWDGQPYQCLQEVLQWNIARDAPMEHCVQQCGCDKWKKVGNCYHRVQSTTGYGVRQRSIAWYASIACHNT